LSQDHLGNTRLVTDEAGNTVARHDYRPFGEELVAGDGFRGAEWGKYDSVTQKFTGQEHDGETEFDFFHARYLSGAQQRFLSADPGNAGADPMNPQSWNAYAYVQNNPMGWWIRAGWTRVATQPAKSLRGLVAGYPDCHI
jgi:RHS repeat-associated protein